MYQLLQKVGAFFKNMWSLKRVHYPVIAYLLLLIVGNIWFNVEDYRFRKAVVTTLSFPAFFLTHQKRYDPTTFSVTIRGHAYRRLRSIRIDRNNVYTYSFYPFDKPRRFPTLLNVDDDSEPEIIYDSARALFAHHPSVYDFDKKTQRFISKDLSSVSLSKYLYTREIRDFLWGPLTVAYGLLFFLLLIYFVLSILVCVGRRLWKKSKKEAALEGRVGEEDGRD